MSVRVLALAAVVCAATPPAETRVTFRLHDQFGHVLTRLFAGAVDTVVARTRLHDAAQHALTASAVAPR